MRGAALLVTMAMVGCATVSPAPEKKAEAAKPAQPGKNEVVVIGKGQTPIPGLRSTDQETEFTIYHGKPYRCTKVKGSPEHGKGVESCRDLSTGAQGDPDTGLIDRGSKNIRR
jgi:hypothetical protein